MRIAISYELIYNSLVEFLGKKEIDLSKIHRADADVQKLIEDIEVIRKFDEKMAIVGIYANLYNNDYEALRRDLAMLSLVEFDYSPNRSERVRLLCILLGATKKFVGDDYSLLLNECSRVIDFHAEIEDLPYV